MAKKGRDKAVQAAINKGKKAWKEARETKPGGSDFSAPKLKKYGTHKCKWDGAYGTNKNEQLYATLTWEIVGGADKGKSHNKYYAIQNDDDPDKALKALSRLAADVQALTGVDTSEDEYEDISSLFDLIDEIHKDSPIAMTDIKENGEYLNVFINELLDEEGDDDEDESDDEDEEDEDEEEEVKPKRGAKKATAKTASGGKGGKKPPKDVEEDEEEDDDEEDEEEEDEEAQEPEKGDTVSYKPPRAKKEITCEVKTVNKRAQTCKLESEDGEKTFADVPWDKLVW